MKRNTILIKILALAAVLGLLAGCSSGTPAAQATEPAGQAAQPDEKFAQVIPLATGFVDQLAQGDFGAAASRFDATMKGAMPEDKLKETWEQLQGQVGAYQSQLGTRTDEQQGYRRVFVTTQFEKAVIDVMVVFDSQGQIAGLFFQPGQAPGATPQSYNPPEYVQSGSFHEVDVTVGSGEWALPGTLTLPEGRGPFPL